MDKIKRSERLIALTLMLAMQPNQVLSYGSFCERFGAAKSSISEDISLIEKTLQTQGLGELRTLAGAAGGARFRPVMAQQEAADIIQGIVEALNEPERVLPGGYLYLSDLLSNPTLARQMGRILAQPAYALEVDFVLTMETKGIPVAMMTADALNVPMVIARRSSKVYEGSAVNISYPDGKGGIETMSLSRRAIQGGQKALIVDDFMRQGGTARGMVALMKEFEVEVSGLAFMLALENPQPLIPGIPQWPLMTFTGNGMDAPMRVKVADWLQAQGGKTP